MVRTTPLALVCLLAPAISLTQPAIEQPKFTAGVTVIEVAASVRDGQGRFVPGLARNDFELKVDGRTVPIESFASVSSAPTHAEEGRFIVLLFDDLATSPTMLTRMREIASNLADRMGPYDEGAVLATVDDAMRSTTSRDELKSRIASLKPFDKLEPVPGDSIVHALDTIADLSKQMASVERRRKVIVVIGSSGLFDTTRPSPSQRADVEQAWLEATRTAARNNVAVYVIDPQGLTETAAPAAAADAPNAPLRLAQDRAAAFSGSSGFAGETGGLAFANTNNFRLAVDRIWSDIANYYLLGYTAPSPGKTDKAPRLSVHVKRPGVDVQARRTAG